MTISNELMLAILAMDSYNRGYNAGIGAGPNGLGITGFIGNAEIKKVEQTETAVAASFFAISYSYNGRTVISYRGTDVLPTDKPNLSGSWTDIGQWQSIYGSYNSTQQKLAADFYRTVVAGNPSQSIQLTGHSLGGALAGFVGSLYGRQATMFDNIAFEQAAQNLTTPVTALSYIADPFEAAARLAAQQYYFGSNALSSDLGLR
jgi:Lipase (class 3)